MRSTACPKPWQGMCGVVVRTQRTHAWSDHGESRAFRWGHTVEEGRELIVPGVLAYSRHQVWCLMHIISLNVHICLS